jgi:hypothetical protein
MGAAMMHGAVIHGKQFNKRLVALDLNAAMVKLVYVLS